MWLLCVKPESKLFCHLCDLLPPSRIVKIIFYTQAALLLKRQFPGRLSGYDIIWQACFELKDE